MKKQDLKKIFLNQFCEKCVDKFIDERDPVNRKCVINFCKKCKNHFYGYFYSELCPTCRIEGNCLSCGVEI